MFGEGKSLGSAISTGISEFGRQGRFAGSIECSTERWCERFGERAIVLFIGSHSCGTRGAERRTTYGIATLREDLQAWWHSASRRATSAASVDCRTMRGSQYKEQRGENKYTLRG